MEILKKMSESKGSIKKNETEVVGNYKEILEIEKSLQKKYSDRGLPASWGDLGAVFENPWYVFLNEPVYFPHKENLREKIAGSYLRVLFKGEIEGEKSLLCLPVLDSGDFILTVSYRTTVRNWVIEAPGTVTKENETHEQALQRCIREKLGHKLLETSVLSKEGFISERGIMGASVPVYLAKIGEKQIQKPTDLNVRQVVKISLEKLKEGFLKGRVLVNGKACLCQDGYTASALFMLDLKNKS